ncbi:MAG: DUF7411 family protein [Polaribacter sp.]
MQIILNNNKGFYWHKNDTVFVKGSFFDTENRFYENENALSFLNKIKTKEDFINTIKELNGSFSIILKIKDVVCVASDTTRCFPIFYTFQNDELFISDDIVFLKNKFNIQCFDELATLELKASLHTHGKKTLLKNVFQIQSSEYVIFEKNKTIENDFFFSYAINQSSKSSYNFLKKEAVITFENVFKRFIKSLDNKTVVVPLSGGFDSRFIAVMLKKYHYKNVVCYTYGRKDSFEIENSKKTAETLGYQWHFIEYNAEIIENYLQTSEFKKYAHFAGKFSSTPNLQEYFAVKYLKENYLIPEDAIFVPGYAGDLLGGSQFIKIIPKNLKTKELIDLILRSKFSNYKLSYSEINSLKKEIANTLFYIDKNYHQKIPYSVFENYDISEKIAKYIFNSASFYTFFDYQHRFPFWDKDLLEFFKKIPPKFKKMKMLFDDVLVEHYFKPYNIYFENELSSSKKSIYLQKIKDVIKSFFPIFIKQKILQKNDWNNYKPITQQMITSLNKNTLKVKKKSKNYNEIIAQWYLYFSKEMIK